MAPSESSILEQFLLAPSQLPTILPLDDFVALFPRSLQSSPQVRALYRDLQRQRSAVVDAIAADIDDEVARGRVLRRHALRARLRADAQEDAAGDDELQIERFVAASTSGNNVSDGIGRKIRAKNDSSPHTLTSIVPELDAAIHDLEAEVQQLEEEEARLLALVQQSIGNLSDLRYGRLANPQLRDQVLEGLQNVQATCERMTTEANTASKANTVASRTAT
ncbi:hypothetical protein SEUCBS139899_009000 [Sporothrix eucalyptigena]|uniref:Centromere-localized protein 2 n=1 Tax=Sporothrix eucalyptigena TaxID=1812306 RepID=A0ABP0AMG1_9PEZI